MLVFRKYKIKTQVNLPTTDQVHLIFLQEILFPYMCRFKITYLNFSQISIFEHLLSANLWAHCER